MAFERKMRMQNTADILPFPLPSSAPPSSSCRLSKVSFISIKRRCPSIRWLCLHRIDRSHSSPAGPRTFFRFYASATLCDHGGRWAQPSSHGEEQRKARACRPGTHRMVPTSTTPSSAMKKVVLYSTDFASTATTMIISQSDLVSPFLTSMNTSNPSVSASRAVLPTNPTTSHSTTTTTIRCNRRSNTPSPTSARAGS